MATIRFELPDDIMSSAEPLSKQPNTLTLMSQTNSVFQNTNPFESKGSFMGGSQQQQQTNDGT
ncbi:hypothetical protein MGN70_003600 [Eutypa lata]|nr:hypothetical protein MGN70_003600 [Eutypa lata]